MSRMHGRKGSLSIKIDLEKAYDRLSWNFIRNVLDEIGLPQKLINLIMECITSPAFSVLWNGEVSGDFHPSRGIRQGAPLAPYIFVLCMEKLSHMIVDSVHDRAWIPIKAGRSGPVISHLIFADDLLLFAEASVSQMTHVLQVLDVFCSSSGHQINKQKTSIFFSRNVSMELRNDLSSRSGFSLAEGIGRYLGSLPYVGRNKRSRYKTIIDKMQNKLAGWKSQCLSMAGRITLAQSVLGSMTIFNMQHEKFHVTVCREMEKIQRNFVWGSSVEKKKIHLIKWETICLPKYTDGLGFRGLSCMNTVCLLKLCWGVLTDPNALWVRVLKGKYARNESLKVEAVAHDQDFILWKTMASLWPMLLQNTRVSIGNG